MGSVLRGRRAMAGAEPPQHDQEGQPQDELHDGFLLALPDLVPDSDAERGENQEGGHGLMITEGQDCRNSHTAARS